MECERPNWGMILFVMGVCLFMIGSIVSDRKNEKRFEALEAKVAGLEKK